MSAASGTKTRSLKLRCSYAEVERIHLFLHGVSLEFFGEQADEELISTITLAVHEAFTNIVRHAYEGQQKGDIVLNCRPKRKGVEIELVDYGVEFNPFALTEMIDDSIIRKIQSLKDLDELEENQIIGGYGIPIIQAAATSVRYQRSASGGNHLQMYFEKD